VKKLRILLYDSHPASGSGEALVQFLQATFAESICLQCELVSEIEPARLSHQIVCQMQDFRPDLTLFVFGLSWIPHLAETFSAQRANKSLRPLIAVSTTSDSDSIKQALEAGAHDFIVPPFRKDDIVPRIRRWIHEANPQSESIQTLKEKLGLKQFIGESPALMAQLQFLAKYAPHNATVFI